MKELCAEQCLINFELVNGIVIAHYTIQINNESKTSYSDLSIKCLLDRSIDISHCNRSQ